MSVLEGVVTVLSREGIPFAVAGATAMAFHGVSRSTADIDLLVTDPRCLDEALWTLIREAGATVEIRKGDPADPLAGVVRFHREGEIDLDVFAGKYRWQEEMFSRSMVVRFAALELPVVDVPDLILLKLFAGGAQDAWDIIQLLHAHPGESVRTSVEAVLSRLPRDCRDLWDRVKSPQERRSK